MERDNRAVVVKPKEDDTMRGETVSAEPKDVNEYLVPMIIWDDSKTSTRGSIKTCFSPPPPCYECRTCDCYVGCFCDDDLR